MNSPGTSKRSPTRIDRILARELFDSRGKPTVEVELFCSGGSGRAIVPSGASTGQYEACELRDHDARRLGGAGVSRAVQNVLSEISPRLVGQDAADQAEIDRVLCELDGTVNKTRLGANAILGVSLAAAHAAAAAAHISLVDHLHQLWKPISVSIGLESPAASRPTLGAPGLPLPMVNMISGGLHAGQNLDFQDFLALPVGAPTFRQGLEWIVDIYHALATRLTAAGYEGCLVGDEGGFGPRLGDHEQAIEFLLAAIEQVGLRPGVDVSLAIDVAATHFHTADGYRLNCQRGELWSAGQLIDLFDRWTRQYPIVSLEDPLSDDDWDGWREITMRLGGRVQLIGDDLFVTNGARLRQGVENRVANSVLIKLNQIGTLTETLTTLKMAFAAGYAPVISARSGETEDVTIADLAVATGAGQIKIGSVARSERLAKYNQLLRLSERTEWNTWLGKELWRFRWNGAG